MPRSGFGMAIGSYGNSIYLLGGDSETYQLTRYDIDTNKMIDCGLNNLTSSTYGDGQYYWVTNNILFMTAYDSGSALAAFDLIHASFINTKTDINIPHTVNDDACIVSTDAFLYVVGGNNGATYINKVQILAIDNNTWSLNPPGMMSKRGGLSCNIHPQNNLLYAIGGRNGSVDTDYMYLNTIENINITNIDIHSWEYTNGPLLYPTGYGRSVIYKTSILLIAGFYNEGHPGTPAHHLNVVQIIDVITGTVSYGGKLNYGIYRHSAIILQDVIYVFGGTYPPVNTFQYFIIPTNYTTTPTSSPTSFSTQYSTQSPTHYPTQSPTHYPTQSPTHYPTLFPTPFATQYPTQSPTILSTLSSTYPTLSPSTSMISTTHFATSTSMIENISTLEARKRLESTFHVFLCALASFFIIVSLIGFIHSKCIRQNDFFRLSLMLSLALQISDMCSDCFFVINLSTHIYETDDIFNQYLVVTAISILLIVIPVTVSVTQLWQHLNKYWANNNRINVWIAQYSKYLYLLSFITGSSFTAVSLFNCNLCT
eukprot:5162_1